MTRWNSFIDSVKQILKEKAKLPQLFEKLDLRYYTESEMQYLEEYCQIFEPIATTLDILQGQDNTFYEILLPSLLSLKNKLEKMKNSRTFKSGGEILAATCLESLKRRFENIIQLNDNHAIIAALSHPKFKLRWFNVVDIQLGITKDELKQTLINYCKEFYTDKEKNMSLAENEENDAFFDFNESTSTNDLNDFH